MLPVSATAANMRRSSQLTQLLSRSAGLVDSGNASLPSSLTPQPQRDASLKREIVEGAQVAAQFSREMSSQQPCESPARLIALAQTLGLRGASPRQLREGRALAAELIGPGIIDERVIEGLCAMTGYPMLVFEESCRVTGVLGFLPLSDTGVEALHRASFSLHAMSLSHASVRGRAPSAMYILGAAGRTEAARRAVIKTTAAALDHVYWSLPIYTRAFTEDGAAVLRNRLGFRPIGQGDIVVRLPGYGAGQAAQFSA